MSPGQPARRRLFFALPLDEVCRARLAAAAQPVLRGIAGRALAPADWHVTLCFLGAVDEALLGTLRAGAGRLRASPFALRLARLDYWRASRLIAAQAAEPPPAAALELAAALGALSRGAGLVPDEQPLRPHVTLMRGVSPALWQQAGPAPAADLTLELTLAATEFQLMESRPDPPAAESALPPDGAPPAARYRSLSRWPLSG